VKQKQIVALGGGGFSDIRDNLALDSYILSLTAKTKPRVCFLPTASGDSETYIQRFYKAFDKLGAATTHLSLFLPTQTPAKRMLLAQDVIYVGGGNTRNMLLLWKDWGVDAVLRLAYAQGTILAGTSAGALCWFKEGLTDSNPGGYTALSGLGWIKGSFCPHFDSEPRRRPIFRSMIRLGKLAGGYAVDDGAALHFVDGALSCVVSSRASAGARFLCKQRGRLVEDSLSPSQLAAPKKIRRSATKVRPK
jgi:dipeptidase E